MTVLFFFSNVILTSKNDQSNRDLLGRITLYIVAQSVRNKKILSTTKIHLLLYNVKYIYQVCTRFKNQAHTIFGRRSDHLLLTMDGNCCDGDLCNHQPLIHTTTTTTTTTTHAPITKPTTTKATTHAHTHHHTVPPTTAFRGIEHE